MANMHLPLHMASPCLYEASLANCAFHHFWSFFSKYVMVRVLLFILMLALSLGAGRSLGALGAQAISVYVNRYAATLPPQASASVGIDTMRRFIPPQQFNLILEANIFNSLRRAAAENESVSSTQTPGPSTLPSLTLNGVSLLGANLAFAFISTGDGKQRVYQHSHCVPALKQPSNGICTPRQGKITTIKRDHVVLTTQGKRITLKLEQSRPKTAKHGSRTHNPRTPAPLSTQRRSTSSSEGAPFPSEPHGENLTVFVPAPEVERAFANFSKILQQARIVPYNRGVIKGFQIRSIRPNSVFARLHMQNFDVILAINGQSVATADQALQLFTAFRNDREVNLTIRRGGRTIRLGYKIQ